MPHDRRPAYADLLGALLSLRPDAATTRFDALLAELVADGRLDPADARELRWWQRESVRGVGDFLAETAPDLLAGLESSQRRSDEAVVAASEAWELATDPSADVPTDTGAPADLRSRSGAGDPTGVLAADHDDPDGPYEPVVPRPAPEPTAVRPPGARLRKAAGEEDDDEPDGEDDERAPEDGSTSGHGAATFDDPAAGAPVVVDLRTRTAPTEPPSARGGDTAPPPGRADGPTVASPRRRLLLSTHPLTTRTDAW